MQLPFSLAQAMARGKHAWEQSLDRLSGAHGLLACLGYEVLRQYRPRPDVINPVQRGLEPFLQRPSCFSLGTFIYRVSLL
jgi:hypothetical protein